MVTEKFDDDCCRAREHLIILLLCKISHNPDLSRFYSIHRLSLYRRLRVQVSRALRNLSANPDRDMTLSAIKQFGSTKSNQSYEPSFHSVARISGVNDSTAGERNSPTTRRRHLSLPSPLTVLDAQVGGSKTDLEKTIGDLTSVLSLAFQSDTIRLSSSDRHFLPAFGPKRLAPKMPTNFSAQEKHLNCLKVFTNVLVVMSNVITIRESEDDKTGETSFDARLVLVFTLFKIILVKGTVARNEHLV